MKVSAASLLQLVALLVSDLSTSRVSFLEALGDICLKLHLGDATISWRGWDLTRSLKFYLPKIFRISLASPRVRFM
jgi:hypothetical protein